jgi:Big-like domain-containing protein
MRIARKDRLVRAERVVFPYQHLLPARVVSLALVLVATLAVVPANAMAQTDVIVNNPARDTNDDHTTQIEPSMAVRGNTICAGYNDTGDPAGPIHSGLSRSTNNGTAWTDLGSIGVFPQEVGDPSLAVHQASGTFYYAENATLPGGHANFNAIGVARSNNNCQTFGNPVDASAASSGDANTVNSDKAWIAVDNTGGTRDGNVYVCWTRNFNIVTPAGTTNAFELRFSRSTDGGGSYIDEQVLAPIAPDGTRAFGCSVAVGPNGEVNVAWANRAAASGNYDVFFRRSIDGGVTFPTPAAPVSAANRTPGSDRIRPCPNGDDPGRTDFTLNGDIRQLHQAWMAVDSTGGPFNGNIYVVWASDPVGMPDNSDVFFSRSTNGGTIWDPPVQIGAGGGATDQYEPNLAVGDNGELSIAWYDRRNDPANNLLIDVYKTFSRTGGTTFVPITRTTDQSFGVPPLNPNFDTFNNNCAHGEYISVAADANNFYYIWTDNRRTFHARPDPDIFFEREPAATGIGQPATLTLAPKTATNPVDSQHCVTATVKDTFGNPLANVTVRFSVSGSVNTSGSRTTNGSGQATFCYQGPPLPGADLITAFADSNNSGAQDVGEPFDTATKTWVLPSGTALCVVKITNGGWIIANNGDRASFGGNAQESEELVASGNEEYQDHGPAQPMNVHSLNVQALTCANNRTRGTIFGQATIDGTGVHNFRIDVQDLGEPGKGRDTYRMRLDTGYDSGEHTLRGGNVQIH